MLWSGCELLTEHHLLDLGEQQLVIALLVADLGAGLLGQLLGDGLLVLVRGEFSLSGCWNQWALWEYNH